MRLALKLSLAMMIGLVIALAIDGYIDVHDQVEVFETAAQRDLLSQGRAMSAAVAKLWQSFGDLGPIDVVLRSAEDPVTGTGARYLTFGAVLQNPTATQLATNDLKALIKGRSVVHLVRGDNLVHAIYSYTPVDVGSGVVGVVEMWKRLPEGRFFVQRLGRAAGTVAVLAVVTWLVAVALGARLVGQPVAALIDKAQRAGRGDFSRPLVLRTRDELERLANTFNDMCDQLDGAQKRVERETQARLAAMNQLRRADRLTTVGRLAAGLAHEVGTPLNVISERVKMLAADELAPDERPGTFSIILAQLDRITSTIRQLLDFSRQHEPEKMRTDLEQLARQTAELVTPIAEKQGVEVLVHEPGEAVVADVDPRQLQQVLTNLIINGVQATTRPGKLDLRLGRTRARAPSDGNWRTWWTLTVEDHGAGIPRHVLPHVFEPFFTTKGVGEGTGLGLSVSLGIVEEHGGFIAVESEVGRGSTFTVHLPAGGET